MLVSCTITEGLLCSSVVVDGMDETGLGIIRCSGTGDVFTGVMGTTGTSAEAMVPAV